ncbi:MAG: hypothetical protein KAU27_12185 [Desulfuromonadales bacterium]|nr:hypothetical protein [Desulfuromonadales bacterium]
MSKQLNLRVDESFAEGLERLSQKLGRSMASVLEAIGKPAIDAAEADLQFEADALTAWEGYELTGAHVSSESIESLFEDAHQRATLVARKRDACQEK